MMYLHQFIICLILNSLVIKKVICSTCGAQLDIRDLFVTNSDMGFENARTALSYCEFGRSNSGLSLYQCMRHCQLRPRCVALFYDGGCEMCSFRTGTGIDNTHDNAQMYIHRDRSAVKGLICNGTTSPLSDRQLLASSSYSSGSINCRAEHSCLLITNSYWAPSDIRVGDWIQVSFPTSKIIAYLETRGSNLSWITNFQLYYGITSSELVLLGPFTGNSDGNTIVRTTLSEPIVSSVVRLSVTGYHIYPSLRWELYGY